MIYLFCFDKILFCKTLVVHETKVYHICHCSIFVFSFWGIKKQSISLMRLESNHMFWIRFDNFIGLQCQEIQPRPRTQRTFSLVKHDLFHLNNVYTYCCSSIWNCTNFLPILLFDFSNICFIGFICQYGVQYHYCNSRIPLNITMCQFNRLMTGCFFIISFVIQFILLDLFYHHKTLHHHARHKDIPVIYLVQFTIR